ncbi:MFS transporter [Fervidibacillus halotolerans]|uniref:MFS transporter n=1 Tax=Fervidibacillus halotolerans TaxID=2980027 RepID=A0A9E8LXT0_9BACI|nr:MFS transporter [Fervidibacillus halotolerans]WAA11713.1 MFS transporter [Fervidibacillus halotolerans]
MEDKKINKEATYNLITFVISKGISNIGWSTYSFGMSLYILQITGSATNFAINFLLSSVPRIVLSPIAGYTADTYDKKRTILLSHLASVIAVLSLLIFNIIGQFSLIQIYVTTALLSSAALFNSVTFTSSIMNLVDDKRTQNAFALNDAAKNIGSILGPVIGGILYINFTLHSFFIIFIVSFTIAFLLDLTMDFRLFSKRDQKKVQEKDGDFKKKGMVSDILDGIRYVKNDVLLSNLISISLFVSLFFTSIQVGMPFVLVNELNLSSEKFGFVQSAFSVGMILTTLYLSVRKEFQYPFILAKRLIIVLSIQFALMVVPFFYPLSENIMFLYFILWSFSIGSNIIFMNTPVAVKLMKLVSEDYRGRVIGSVNTLSSALVPLGLFSYGILFDYVGAEAVMLATSLLSLLFTFVLMRKSILMRAHPEYFVELEKRKNNIKEKIGG